MTEPTDEQTLVRAAHAKQIFNDALFKEIIAEIREDLIRRWEDATVIGDRETTHADLHALTRITNLLYSIGESGEILTDQLEKKERREQ